MGLDIYLSRYDDFNKAKALESEYREFEEAIWKEAGEYDSLTQEQKDDISKKCKDFAESLGLDKWGSCETGTETIELDHPTWPEHMFKIGYFRSSYNGGGIERILRNLGVSTLSDIFNHTSDGEYEFRPDWQASLDRCEEAIATFTKVGAYRVHHVSSNMFREPNIHSEKEALDAFLNELSAHENAEYNYSNGVGEFSVHEPMKVLAMIPGTYKIFNEMPCTYVITESDNSWYLQALEIVKDTIKYVLEKENKEQYYLRWSG